MTLRSIDTYLALLTRAFPDFHCGSHLSSDEPPTHEDFIFAPRPSRNGFASCSPWVVTVSVGGVDAWVCGTPFG
jgi:hypothetical protein